MNSVRDPFSAPAASGFLGELHAGRLRWDLLAPFPARDAEDRAAGDRAVAEVTRFVAERIDPEAVDATGALPAGFIQELRRRGLLKLGADREIGGWGLSPADVSRVITAVAARSLAVALVLATDNAFGLSAHLPHLPPGPLRDLVLGHVVRGAVSCATDIALEGAARFSRRMVAVPTRDGRGYEINGDQVFVGNAPIADVVIVSAVVTENGATGRRLFFVDAATPGLRVHARHEFMGVRGFPNGGLTFDRVRVPRTRTLAQDSGTGLTVLGASPLAAFGLHHLIAAPSLALARLGTAWARDHATRRKADGRPLGEYDEVQRLLASSAADTFAVESLIAWATTRPAPDDPVQALLEQLAVNNMSSVAAGRVLDRTVSLLAAEGIETSRSKARRGASPVPLERAVRDATALRIAGGVDFRLDLEAGRAMLRAQTARPLGAGDLLGPPGPGLPRGGKLSGRNAGHARYAARQARDMAKFLRGLREHHQRTEALSAREGTVISANRIINEIFTMAVVLARAASLAEAGNDGAQGLADVHCADARRRIADLWAAARAAQTGDEPDYPAVAALPVAVGRPEEIVRDMVLASRRGTRKQDRADAFRHQAPASRAGRGNTTV